VARAAHARPAPSSPVAPRVKTCPARQARWTRPIRRNRPARSGQLAKAAQAQAGDPPARRASSVSGVNLDQRETQVH
jgi:hypothetical protein